MNRHGCSSSALSAVAVPGSWDLCDAAGIHFLQVSHGAGWTVPQMAFADILIHCVLSRRPRRIPTFESEPGRHLSIICDLSYDRIDPSQPSCQYTTISVPFQIPPYPSSYTDRAPPSPTKTIIDHLRTLVDPEARNAFSKLLLDGSE